MAPSSEPSPPGPRRFRGPTAHVAGLLAIALVATGLGAYALTSGTGEADRDAPGAVGPEVQTRLGIDAARPARRTGLRPSSRLTPARLGPLRIGMTLATAERRGGIKLLAAGPTGERCAVRAPEGEPRGVSFLFLDGRLAVVLVRNPAIRTPRGVRTGTGVAALRRAYGRRLRRTGVPNEWMVTGRRVRGYPTRTIFATDGRRVISMRSGLDRVGRERPVTWLDWCI